MSLLRINTKKLYATVLIGLLTAGLSQLVVGQGISDSIEDDQSDSLSLDAIALRVGTFLNAQLSIAAPVKRVHDTVVVNLLFAGQYSNENQNEAFTEFYNKEKTKYTSDPGLKLTGNYTENFEPGILDNEDLSYYRRFYLGIEWDLLSGGLVSNIKRARVLDKELEIKKLENIKSTKESNYLYIYNYLTYLFKRQKIEKLNQRSEVLKEQLNIAHQLYFLRYVQWEDVIALQSKLLEVEVLKNNNDVYYNRRLKNSFPEMLLDDSFLYHYLPILDINASRMIEIFNKSAVDKQLTELKLEKIDLEYNRFAEWSLRPFVRFNYLVLDQNSDRSYTSAGLSMSIPLKLKSHQGQVREASQQIMNNYQETERFGNSSELLNHYYEYQFKKMQYISFYFKLLLVEERLRKEIVKRDLALETFSPLRAISILDEKISIEIEMIDLKKDLYLKFLKIYSMLEETNPNNFASIIRPEELSRRYQGERSLYIWSSTFRSTPLNTLLAYLHNTEIKEVLLSVGNNAETTEKQKITDFVLRAQSEEIITALMIGTKRIDSSSAQQVLSSKVEEARQWGMKGLHLDVEFHTLEDYHSNATAYEDEYLQMLQTARQLCDTAGLTLSVSIPVYLNDTLLSSIYNLTDKVYLMAYQHPDIDYIIQKTSEEFTLDASKTVVALSASDFSDRLRFEAFAKKLLDRLGSSQLAIHDLQRLLKLDDQSVHK